VVAPPTGTRWESAAEETRLQGDQHRSPTQSPGGRRVQRARQRSGPRNDRSATSNGPVSLMIALGYMKYSVAASKEQPGKEARGPGKHAATLHSNTAYDNDSVIFGPFALLVHLLLLKCPLPLRRASFDKPSSSCASSLVSSCALLVLLVPPVSLAAFSLE
jgi:hypothetical protein